MFSEIEIGDKFVCDSNIFVKIQGGAVALTSSSGVEAGAEYDFDDSDLVGKIVYENA